MLHFPTVGKDLDAGERAGQSWVRGPQLTESALSLAMTDSGQDLGRQVECAVVAASGCGERQAGQQMSVWLHAPDHARWRNVLVPELRTV